MLRLRTTRPISEYHHGMKRPSKKEIKAIVDGLKDKSTPTGKPGPAPAGKLAAKKSSQRIRKQGI